MLIKLLCINTCYFSNDGDTFSIEEGDTVNALVGHDGVRFEYKKDHYTLPYYFEDVFGSFISAFDEESYNEIYKKVNICKIIFDNGKTIDIGDARVKVTF